jgi:hypothetical protein
VKNRQGGRVLKPLGSFGDAKAGEWGKTATLAVIIHRSVTKTGARELFTRKLDTEKPELGKLCD